MITEKRTSGPNFYGKAKALIPGGNMLLSKRPEMFLPDFWPSYFSKTDGCKVWCINGNEYTDMLMTPGTNILGYNYPSVSEAVAKVVQDGNMSSLNALHPRHVLYSVVLQFLFSSPPPYPLHVQG